MGLSSWVAEQAVAGAHVLLVDVPGAWAVRVAAEQRVARRGWQLALSPADADVLMVCGRAGPQLVAAVDTVWEQLPGPRARVGAAGVDEVAAALDESARLLGDETHQCDDARERARSLVAEDGHDGHDGMEMSGPGGIALAGGDMDRDGLEMDVLHVPLGPVLPYWPAGLVLWGSLHGDVFEDVHLDVLDPAAMADPEPPAVSSDPAVHAARSCDEAAALLTLAGWGHAAVTARGLRDMLLAGAPADRCVPELDRLVSRVRRSRTLRWAVRGLGVVDEVLAREHGLPERVRGDVHDRLAGMLDRARALAAGQQPTERSCAHGEPTAVLDALPHLLHGVDIAAVRLVVGSFAVEYGGLSAEPARGASHA